uniref:Uncharacterized protein n=1 Tax=Plectus sambesii TaxID=2011161 RepID=A0A914WQK1_9BILA
MDGLQMEAERWVERRMETLRMKNALMQSGERLPPKLERRMLGFDPNERNPRGETLLIGVIRYLTDAVTQIRYANMLLRSGSDATLSETRHKRTPLMFACMERNESLTRLLISQKNVDLTAQDRLGNTALMYATIHGHANIVNILVNELTRKWSFDIFRVKNCMGHTAESLAKKNGRYDCAALLKRERIQMFQRMHRQLALIHFSAQIKGWENYGTTYKAKDLFMQRRAPDERTKTIADTPNLPKLSQKLLESVQDGPGRMFHSRSVVHFGYVLQLPIIHASSRRRNSLTRRRGSRPRETDRNRSKDATRQLARHPMAAVDGLRRLAALLLLVQHGFDLAYGDSVEDRLYKTLLTTNYEKAIRPTLHHTVATNVTFGFLLNQIVDVDERNQVLTTRSWLNVNWLDPRLRWNASDWEGIKVMYFPHERLWKPDIILVNNADREYREAIVSTDIMATSNGNVTWLFSAIFRSSCQIRVRYYPFDDQECLLKFAAWSHHMDELDLGLTTDKGDLSSYMNNSEFDLLDMTAVRELHRFPCCPDLPWPLINIKIKMKRRPLFYVFNHILPCVLISSMAILGFYVPPDTGEKITMCITTMLSMGVYLKTITESIPPTSEAVPLIGVYYVVSLAIVCLATCVNVWTLSVHRNGSANQGGHVPRWIQNLILGYLATFMRITIHEPDSLALLKAAQKKTKSTVRRQSMMKSVRQMVGSRAQKKKKECPPLECDCEDHPQTKYGNVQPEGAEWSVELTNPNHMSPPPVEETKKPKQLVFFTDASEGSRAETYLVASGMTNQLAPRVNTNPALNKEFEERFRRILKRIYRTLQHHEMRQQVGDERARIQWEWQQLATVIDRILLIGFFFTTACTTFFILVEPVIFADHSVL